MNPPRLEGAPMRLLHVALAGLASQLLFDDAALGLNFMLWALLPAGYLALMHGGATADAAPRRRLLWALLPVVAALPCVLYASRWSLLFAVPTTLFLLCCAPLVLAGGAGVMLDLPRRLSALFRGAPAAVGEGVALPFEALNGHRRWLYGGLLGIAVGVPVAGLFVVILSFDSAFRALLARVAGRMDSAVWFGVGTIGYALLFAVAGALFASRRLAAHEALTAPIAPRAPRSGPYRDSGQAEVEPALGPLHAALAERGPMLPVAWGIVLANVASVFALYAVANRHALFGGHARIREVRELTYAGYVHAGFFELLFATALAVGLVLVGHRLFRDGRGRHAVLRGLEVGLLALSGVALVSCAQRLAVYVEAYGHTYLRLGVAVVCLSVGSVVLLTAVKALLPRFHGYGALVLLAQVALGAGCAFFDADGSIARANLDRAQRGLPLDTAYLFELGADARPALDHEYFKDHEELRRELDLAFRLDGDRGLREQRGALALLRDGAGAVRPSP